MSVVADENDPVLENIAGSTLVPTTSPAEEEASATVDNTLPSFLTISIEDVVILIFPIFIPSASPTIVDITVPSLTNFNEAVCRYKSLKGLSADPMSNCAASLGTI